MPPLTKIVFSLVFLTYMIGIQSIESISIKFNALDNCKVCAQDPFSDIPHNDENGESIPCDSEETQEEIKEIASSAELHMHFSCSGKMDYYSYRQLVLCTPYRNIFSPPPEC